MTDGGGEIPYTFACVAFIFHLKNLRTARFFVKKYGPHGGGDVEVVGIKVQSSLQLEHYQRLPSTRQKNA